MSIDLNPSCPVIARFAEDLKLSGKRIRTQQSYCRAARKFAEYLGHSPDLATEDQFRNYLLYLVDCKKWKSSTVNVAMQALKLFYRITCPRDWKSLKLARIKVEQKLPVVISIGEVHTLLKLIEKPSMRCFFTVVYSMGLRMQEALHLQVPDIDSNRMLIHIHRGKGAKDRLVPLPQSTLFELRKYYVSHRNPRWIFPCEGRNHKLAPTADRPMSDSSVQGVIKAVLEQLNWDNPKYLGSSKLGLTGVLHTWGRDLNYHPHVHCIVPRGAISQSGTEWLSSRTDFFLPVMALSKIFRAKYKELMHRAGLLEQIDASVWERAWNVNCQAVGDGRDSLRYLAPYVFRVAIGNHRIRSVECHEDGTGSVTFMVKPSGKEHYRPMTVSAEEFIRRLLQYVLPKGFQKVRHFGFMHKRSKISRVWLAMLVTVTLNMVYVLVLNPPGLPAKQPMCCPDLECLGFARNTFTQRLADGPMIIDTS